MNHLLRSIGIIGVAVLYFGVAGCASGDLPRLSWADPAVDLAWPAPPEKARIRFLRTLSGSADFQKEGKGSKLFSWIAGEKAENLSLASPYGLSADGAGRIWVADAGTHAVHAFDLTKGRVDQIAAVGKEYLISPVGVAFAGASGRLYVSDSALRKIFVADAQGRFQGVLEPPGGFGRPAGLASDTDGNLYVADVMRGRIEVFSPGGAHLKSLGVAIAPGENLNGPTNVFVDRQGLIYVTDSMNFRVVILDFGGKLIRSIGKIGDGAGSFARPRGVAVDSDGHIYVADAAFDNIQVFDSSGRLLLYWGGVGTGAGQFSLPAGLFFDKSDRLYVTDSFNHRIQVFQYLSAESTGKN